MVASGGLSPCACLSVYLCISFCSRPFPAPADDWTAAEELSLADHTRTQGLGAWEDLSFTVRQTDRPVELTPYAEMSVHWSNAHVLGYFIGQHTYNFMWTLPPGSTLVSIEPYHLIIGDAHSLVLPMSHGHRSCCCGDRWRYGRVSTVVSFFFLILRRMGKNTA